MSAFCTSKSCFRMLSSDSEVDIYAIIKILRYIPLSTFYENQDC
jgi:hypothetical protein